MKYENFIRQYLEFFPEQYWEKCIHHIMYDKECWSKEKCKKCANKLRRERLNPKDHIREDTKMICDSPNTPTKGSESSRND